MKRNEEVLVVGGGLAGSEAAYYLASRGIKTTLVEMKPKKFTPAHESKNYGGLVCSNSLKSNDVYANACGLLKQEMRMLGSMVIEAADTTTVPAGAALAVDREGNILYEKKADGAILPELIRTVGEVCGYPMGCAMGKVRCEFNAAIPEGNDKFAPLSRAAGIREFTMANTRCSSDEDAARAVEIIRERLGDYVNPLQNGICIDIPAAGIDKGTGVADYAALMGVSHGEIWTAGDNYNDLAMLTRFRGCAMANGVQAVKDAAKDIYPDIASIVAEMMG